MQIRPSASASPSDEGCIGSCGGDTFANARAKILLLFYSLSFVIRAKA